MIGLRDRRTWLGLGGIAVLTGAGALTERRHLRSIDSDPDDALLREPPAGRPITVRSADGTELHAEEFGPSDGQTVVLIHGWTEALSYWVYVTQILTERGYRVIAYDLRGHGQNGAAAGGDYALERFGEDLEAVLEACVPEGQRAVVVGHSLGAMSIAAWAEHHDVERRVCAAALLNTGVGELMAEHLLIPVPAVAHLINRAVPPKWTLGSRAAVPKVSTPLDASMVRYIAFGPDASLAQVAFYERMLIGCPPDVRADVGIALSKMDLYHALPRLTVPTLVIAGENDRLTPPSHAKRIGESVPQLHGVLTLERTGHMGPLERPQEISDALDELITAASKKPANATA